MGTVETVVTWVLLFASALGVGFLVSVSLDRLVARFSENLASPPIIGSLLGLGLAWYLIDPVQFSTDRGAVPFMLAILIGVIVAFAVTYLARRAMQTKAAQLAVGVLGLVIFTIAGVALIGPSNLVGIAGVVIVASYGAAILLPSVIPADQRPLISYVGGAATAVALIFWLQADDRMGRLLQSKEMDSIATTLWAVVLAVGGSCLLFVTANLVLNRSGRQWRAFSTLSGAIIGFLIFGLMDGNRLLKVPQVRDDLAKRLHQQLNFGPWRLLFGSILVGIVVGWVYDRLLEAISESGKKRTTGLMVGPVLGVAWGVFFANRIPIDTTIKFFWTGLIGAIVCGLLGYVLSGLTDDNQRALVSAGGGAAIGLLLGLMLENAYRPDLEIVPLILATAVLAGVGAGLSVIRGVRPLAGAATGGLLGWLIGAFGVPDLGGGSLGLTLALTAVAGALAGLRFGAKPYLDSVGRDRFEQQSRTLVFLGPALGFITVGLVLPLVRTIYLSFFDERTENWVGVDNYQTVFTDPKSFDYTGRLNIFGSQLFLIGGVLILAAVVFGFVRNSRTKSTMEWGGGLRFVVGPLVMLAGLLEFVLRRQTDAAQGANYLVILALFAAGLAIIYFPVGQLIGQRISGRGVDMEGGMSALFAGGVFFIAFAIFTALRGTVINNLWWVFTVTLMATALGMAVAVLADKAKNENLAKSFIFMPLAISFVGASIIWKFLYIARPATKTQTGVMNYLWVELGKYSTVDSTSRTVSIIILAIALAALGGVFFAGFKAKAQGVMASVGLLGAFIAFVLYRFTLGNGIGGIEGVDKNGEALEPIILFLTQSQPFNNLWLMVVLIWIQTGFAMVIFSAAIKAVPSEFVEASRVDGATDSQIFWKITLPTIAPTVGVVVTTLIVSVMKVFDVVKVMTNGNFDTQVIANEMWQRAFTELNFGLGSALAVVLFLSVVPVMYYNIRNMQKGV